MAEVYSCLFHPKVLRGRVNAKSRKKDRIVRDSFRRGTAREGKKLGKGQTATNRNTQTDGATEKKQETDRD